MKVSPSAQGEIPLTVVKSKSLWVQVPPVSSGSVAYSNGYNNTNQQMQIPVTPHREKSQPKMPSKRLRLLSRVSNNIKVWTSGSNRPPGILSREKPRKDPVLQRQNTCTTGIYRIHYSTILTTKPERNPAKMILAYNISDGDKNFLLQTDLDTFNPLTTNRTDKHNEIHTEISPRYTQHLLNRTTSKPYTQNLLDLNTIKSPRPKTIIRAYLIKNAKQYAIGEVAHDIPDIQRDENQSASARQQPDATELPRSTRDGNKFWEKESAKPSRIHISKTNLSIRQTTSRGVEPHLSNYANSNTNFATRIKTASSTNHVSEFPNTPAQHLDMHQTRFIKIVSTHTDTHNSNVNRTAPVEPRIKAKPILTQRTNPLCKTTTQCWRKPNSTHNLFAYITEGPMKNSLRNLKSLTQLITKTNVQAHLTRRLLKPGQNNTYFTLQGFIPRGKHWKYITTNN